MKNLYRNISLFIVAFVAIVGFNTQAKAGWDAVDAVSAATCLSTNPDYNCQAGEACIKEPGEIKGICLPSAGRECSDTLVDCAIDDECIDNVCVASVGEACSETSDCAIDEECIDDICVSSVGEACSETADCAIDEECIDDICVPSEPECATDADCDDDLFCNGDEMCTEGECIAGTDPCEEGETCNEDIDECVLTNEPCEAAISLKGPGEIEIDCDGADLLIDLTGTTDATSLAIKPATKGVTVLLTGFESDGSLKSIKGKGVVLSGELVVDGGIGKVNLTGVRAGSSIEASWLGKFSVKEGFSGDVNLTGEELSPKKGQALEKFSVKGSFANSEIVVAGDVGSIKVSDWGAGSTLAVGVAAGPDDEFFTEDDVLTGGALGKLKYKSNATDNAGEPFGIIAQEFLKLKTDLPVEDGDFLIEQF